MDRQYEVRITQHAEQAMREIGVYIAVDLIEPETAVRLLKTFQQEIAKLDSLPQRIHLTPEEPWRSIGIRRMRVKNYFIYFWIDEDNHRVQVTDVIYAGRDQSRQLRHMPMEDE